MIVCVDLETTGLDKKKDEIIEVAMIKFDEHSFKIVGKYSKLVNPGIKIPEIVSNITNIFDHDVENAPKINDILDEIRDFIGECPILGHNVLFDKGFLESNGVDLSKNIYLDTFFISNFLCFTESSHNLEMLVKSFGGKLDGAHRALNDVEATIFIFEKLVSKFHKLKKSHKDLVGYVFDRSNDLNTNFLKNYLFGENYFSVKTKKFEKIILDGLSNDNIAGDLPVSGTNKTVDEIFSSLEGKETRNNQINMSNQIMDNLSNSSKLAIEAPTGLGKTFAYLIPSIIHSINSGQKIVVSTKTKNLQDQLYENDLDYLSRNIGIAFNYSKLKGRRNYISLHSFFDEFLLDDLDYYKVSFLAKIGLWLINTKHGELDELNYYGDEYSFLKDINADNIFTISKENKYSNHEFLSKARKNCDKSNIVVINHSLLFSDIKSDKSILGNIDNLIIDEAHNIEDSVTESLRKKMFFNSISDLFISIEKIFNKKGIKKIDFLNTKDSLESSLGILSDYLYSYIESKIGNEQVYKNTLVSTDFIESNSLDKIFSSINRDFLSIIDKLSTIGEYDFYKEKGSLEYYLEIINVFSKQSSYESNICIASFDDRRGVSIEYTLLNPGSYLKTNIWSKVGSVLLTSATLKVGDSFDYFKNIFNLEGFTFSSYETDFDYSRQASLFIINDLGSIKNNSFKVIEFLYKFYISTRGRVLTLLTSFNIIRKIYTSLNIDLKKSGYTLYAQSIGGSKSKLLNSYLESPDNSILLGTDSFWEGVDIPGEKLKYLIIHKFPFMVPNDPIFIARSKFFKNPFLEYSLPKSIIKLKQGFGRIIRSKSDKGVIVLLDDRIYSTDWGKSFYKAFPENINKKVISSESLINTLKLIEE